jgi:two-component system response regulator YesN
MEYINDIRLQHAKRFLEVENISINEVSRRVGFHDANYFSRRFKLYTKMTPVQYKQHFVNDSKRACPESDSDFLTK